MVFGEDKFPGTFLADGVARKVNSQMKISANKVFALVNKFEHSSTLYMATHGAHSAALCDTRNMLIFNEDVGKHNAIGKVLGECILKDMPTKDRVLITSGRIFLEILHKAAKRDIPILISKAAPTDLGLWLADDLGITLIGFVRRKSMNIYTHGWRVLADVD